MKTKLLCLAAFSFLLSAFGQSTNRPSIFDPGSGGGAASPRYAFGVSNRNCFYVSPDGSDSTARRGWPDRPWKNLDVAAAAARAAGTSNYVLLSAGRHVVSNAVVGPVGYTLQGAGSDATIIESWFQTNATPCPTIIVTTNSRFLGFTVSLMLTTYQAGLGTHRSFYPSATNVYCRDVKSTDGQTDGWYVRHTNRLSFIADGCEFGSKWDAITLMEGPHNYWIRNSLIRAYGPNSYNDTRANCLAFETATGARVRFEHCTLVSSNSAGLIVSFGSGDPDVHVSFHNCTLTNYTSTHLIGTVGSGQKLTFENTPVPPELVSNDIGAGTIDYGQLSTDKLIFGGNVDDGRYPTISFTNTVPAHSEPNGSLCLRNNGSFYLRTNNTWVLK